jgi:Protein of unknown function (DUF3969)
VKVSSPQIEQVVVLLTIGLAVALQRRKVSTAVANQILFSPRTMSLLRAAGVRASVVDLVHAGTEVEDIESLIPEELDSELQSMMEDALACLETCEEFDFNAEKWIVQLLGDPRPTAVAE